MLREDMTGIVCRKIRSARPESGELIRLWLEAQVQRGYSDELKGPAMNAEGWEQLSVNQGRKPLGTEILYAFLKTAERRQGRRLFADGFDGQLIELWIFFYLRERFHSGQKGLNCPLLASFRSGNLIHNRGHIQAGPFRQLA